MNGLIILQIQRQISNPLHPSEPDRSAGCQYKTMKHVTLISLSLLAVVCSCTKLDVRTPEQPEREIYFSEPVVSTMTKAVKGEINGLYSASESFGVFSIYHTSEFTSWADGTAYIKGSKFTYNGALDDSDTDDLGGWSGGYFFPKSGYLSFAAYSPYDAHAATTPGEGQGTFAYGPTGLTITDFTVPAALTDQYDLMYSGRLYNKQGNDGEGDGYEGMDLVFQHALSAIHFQVQQKEAYSGYTIKLKGISINDVKYKGSFAEGISDEDPELFESDPKWTLTPVDLGSGLTTYELTTYDVYAGDLTLEKIGGTNYHTDFQGAILMPQRFTSTDTAFVKIDYSIIPPSMSEISQTATVRLNQLSTSWEMGKRYTYNISIGYDTITISPTVIGWENVNGDVAVN